MTRERYPLIFASDINKLQTYKENPQSAADTSDGPGNEEQKDGPEECEDGIAGHDDCLVRLKMDRSVELKTVGLER